MAQSLQGKRVAILSADGFEESELFEPKKALDKAGAETQIISLKKALSKDGQKRIGENPLMWISLWTKPTPKTSML